MKQIAKALLEAQKEMGNAIKDSTNPFFKSKYADLNAIREACMPVLNKHGIVVLQPTFHIEGKNYVKTILLHESGESMESLTEIVYAKQNDAQAQGSGITYARRYGLQSFVNVGADDDDGNLATKQPNNKSIIESFDDKGLKEYIKEGVNYAGYMKSILDCTTLKSLETLFKSFPKGTQIALKDEVMSKKTQLEQLELHHAESIKQKQA